MITLIQRLGSETQKKDEFVDSLIQKIKANPGSCTEVWLSSDYGFPPMETHRKSAAKLAETAKKFRSIGVRVSLQISNTIGHGEYMRVRDCSGLVYDGSPVTRFTGADGLAANYCFCPGGRHLRDYTAEEISLYVSAIKPDCVWFDDDLRMCNHDPVRYGCFCDDCVARFNKKYGMSFSREELVRNINDNTDIRKMYVEFVRGSIGDFAFFLSDAVHSASPDSTIGFQHGGNGGYTGYGLEHIFSAMRDASGKAPKSRPGGGTYDDYDINAFIDKANLINYQNYTLPDYVKDICPEIENLPDVKFGKTIAGTCFETTLYLASGCTSSSYAMLMNDFEPMEWHGEMLGEFARLAPYWERLAECSRNTSQAGIAVALPQKAYLAETATDFEWNNEPWKSGTELECCALSPAYTHDTTNTYFLHHESAAVMTGEELDALLKRPVITDAQTLKILLLKGYDMGAEVRPVNPKLFRLIYTGHTVNRGFAGRKWNLPWNAQDAYAIVGKNGDSNTCEPVLRYISESRESACGDGQPAAALLTTPYGAKWAVFGDGLWNRVISSERRSELLNIAEYINPGRLTAVLETHAKAIILPRENAEHKLVCVTVINATVGKAAELKLRVRNTAGARFSYMSQYNGSGTLTPHRNGEDITLTLPAIDAWSALTVFVD